MMDRVRGVFKRPTPQEQLREWQRRLRQEARDAERQVRDVQKEQKNVEKSIREAVKRNDTGSAKALARELVLSKKAVERLYESKARLNSISLHLGENVAMAKVVGHLSKSVEVMKLVTGLMKVSEMSVKMQELQREMIKAGVIEETINESLDSTLDHEDMEEEIEEEVDKVLSEVAGETLAQLPTTSRRDELKQKQAVEKQRQEAVEQQQLQQQQQKPQQQALAEGADDEAELEDLRARLASVRT